MAELDYNNRPIIVGEPAPAARSRLKRLARAFSASQAAEQALIEAADLKAKADALAVAEAERQDAERKLVGAWERRLSRDMQYQRADCSDEELEKRRIALGIPKEATRCDDGSFGFGAAICAHWARVNEQNEMVVERQRQAVRKAALDREADRLIAYEADRALQEKMEA